MSEKEYTYIGWVPCISGNLIFEYASCGLSNRLNYFKKVAINNVEENEEKIPVGYIFISSVVDWKDKGPGNLKGNYYVVLTGTYKTGIIGNNLSGKIYILPFRKAVHQWLEIINTAKKTKIRAQHHKEIQNDYETLIHAIEKTNDIEFNYIEYELLPSGIAFLSNPISKRDLSLIEQKTISRQSFYYLKYAIHKHQHHSTSDDALTTIHEITENEERNALNLINDLRKSLVCLKRDLRSTRYKWLAHTRGITSYAKSLIEVCYKHKFFKVEVYNREKSYFENLADSLEITASSNISAAQNKLAISNHIRSTILFFIAIVGPIILVYRENIRQIANLNLEDKDAYHVHDVIIILGQLFANPYELGKLLLIPITIFSAYWLFLLVFGNFSAGVNWIFNKANQSKNLVSNIFILIAAVLVIFGGYYLKSAF